MNLQSHSSTTQEKSAGAGDVEVIQSKNQTSNSFDAMEQLDAVCDVFERDWKAGRRPNPKDYAMLVDPSLFSQVFRELVMVEKECEEFHEQSEFGKETHRSDDTLRRTPVGQPDLPMRFSKFILLEKLGSGSGGVVYKADDVELDRVVAIKLPHRWHCYEPEYERTLLLEARNAAKLAHPGIVKVFEVDTWEATPYLVSEYIEGETLRSLLARGDVLSFREKAELAMELADALSHAHTRGVIHRDLKPSNVMIEEVVSGDSGFEQLRRLRPRLLDFGIARLMDSDLKLTREGEVVGTPAYMSPEQARGEGATADARSDVYGLGVILYELLCGSTPFKGDLRGVVDRIGSQQVPSLLSKNPLVPSPLAAICHKCLALEAQDRYASADELKQDLSRWVSGQSVLARLQLKPSKSSSMVYAMAGLSAVVALAIWLGVGRSPLGFPKQESSQVLPSNLTNWKAQLPLSLSDVERTKAVIGNANVDELLDVSIALSDHESSANELAKIFADTQDEEIRCRIACVLGNLDPKSLDESRMHSPLASWLSDEVQVEKANEWNTLIRPIGRSLRGSILNKYKNSESKEKRQRLAHLLFDCIKQDPAIVSKAILHTSVHDLRMWERFLNENQEIVVPALAASLVDSSLPVGDGKPGENSARNQAKILTALYMAGNTTPLWPAMRHQTDPRIRTYLCHYLASSGASLETFVQCLPKIDDPSIKQSIVLTLGLASEYLTPSQVERLLAWSEEAYTVHPDSGVHMACYWILKKFGRSDVLSKQNAELALIGMQSDKQWYVNSIGMNMLIIRPSDFWMGDPAEDQSVRLEQYRFQEMSRPFAISATEVQGSNLEAYAQEHRIRRKVLDDAPWTMVTWDEAMRFCDWISNREGIMENRSVLTQVQGTQVHIDESLGAYRLPYATEFEYASKAGTTSRFFFGNQLTDFAQEYGGVENNSEGALTIMNQFGLFDTIGGVEEWTASACSIQSGQQQHNVIFDTSIAAILKGFRMSRVNGLPLTTFPLIGYAKTEKLGFRVCRPLIELESLEPL